MQPLRVVALILGSTWFFPVSCITGVIVGVPVVAHMHERHMDKGEQPHSRLFTVVWQPGEAGEPFGYSRLADLARDKTPAPARSFIMAQPSGRSEAERIVVTYKVLSSGASEQLIEVTWDDDKYGSVSRYRATPSGVTPVFSRIMDPGFVFLAFLPAAAFAAGIYAVGVWLRRRIARARERSDASAPGASK